MLFMYNNKYVPLTHLSPVWDKSLETKVYL